MAVLLGITACGDAGVGFNITKAVPITVPVNIPIPDPSDAGAVDRLLNLNPPSKTVVYDLNDIEAFEGALDGLRDQESIIINSLAYQFEGLDSNEEVDMDGMLITLNTFDTNLDLLNVRRRLQNIDRTPISLTQEAGDAMVRALTSGEPVTADIVFDLAELPADADSITFDYSLIFDITIRARDL